MKEIANVGEASENAALKRRIRLARDIAKSPAYAERRYFREDLLELLDLRKPLPKARKQ